MIRRLRNKFIRIATLSVAAVMLMLTLILNVANVISTDSDLRQTLDMIYENEGTIPQTRTLGAPPDLQTGESAPAPRPDKDGPFNQETPFSTRFFVLRYQDDGTLDNADLNRIAAVNSDTVDEYLAVALTHGERYGIYKTYRYVVHSTRENRKIAIFLDSYQQLRTIRNVLLWSLAADAVCILLVFLLVVVFSRRAIDPVVQSAQRQKQFITDAGHELKTPITVISTSLRVLEMEVGKQKWIDKAQAQTEKLTALVNSLVTLSRMDEEESPLKMSPFSISEAVTQTAESFRDFAAERGLGLHVSAALALTYCGDEYAVRQLVSILMDNAVKYAAAQSDIAVTLEKARHGVRLAVSNACEPIGEKDMSRMFDRFYRVDPSRNAATGGFGIGLSIARSIAEGHKGSITADYKDGRIRICALLK
mgnify:FL=1